MPGCVLRASGESFRPHKFLDDSAFVPCNIFLKGERKANERVWDSSGFTVVVSEGPDDDLAQQIREACEFLRRHEEELARLMKCAGLEEAWLDFGVSRKDGFMHSSYLPPELLRLAGALGLGVEISIYGEGGS